MYNVHVQQFDFKNKITCEFYSFLTTIHEKCNWCASSCVSFFGFQSKIPSCQEANKSYVFLSSTIHCKEVTCFVPFTFQLLSYLHGGANRAAVYFNTSLSNVHPVILVHDSHNHKTTGSQGKITVLIPMRGSLC